MSLKNNTIEKAIAESQAFIEEDSRRIMFDNLILLTQEKKEKLISSSGLNSILRDLEVNHLTAVTDALLKIRTDCSRETKDDTILPSMPLALLSISDDHW